MSINILDGKALSKKIKQQVELDIKYIKALGIIPTLAVIQVGEDKASSTYVKNKSKACKEVEINFKDYNLPEDTSGQSLFKLIDDLNKDDNIHGILIQQPVPNHLKGLEQYIDSSKDVDGFCYSNVGKLQYNEDTLIPCTAKGIFKLLDEYKIDVEGKHIVVIGRSNIVGKPISMLALNKNATITICHSKTIDLDCITSTADILISAIGKPKFIDSSYLSFDTKILIDVGINRDENNKLCGDFDFDNIIEYWNMLENNCKTSEDKMNNIRYITPVPGGIGPLTIACLLENVGKAAILKLIKK